jgi:hypothetical protein
MPRLLGKRSNTPLYLTLLLAIAIVATAIPLEYFGIINLVPQFGKKSYVRERNRPPNNTAQPPIEEPMQ